MKASHRIARSLVHRLLRRLRHGRLTLSEGAEQCTFGESGGIEASIELRSPAVYPAFLRGSAGLAESYIGGLWSSPDLVSLTRLAALNMEAFDVLRRRALPIARPPLAARAWLTRNTPERSRKQIHEHYDLGNDLFELMLDSTLTYSCAIFPTPKASLEEAQINKLETICEMLDLRPGERVIEIGSGWGGFAMHAAEHYGVDVITTTISPRQRELALSRVKEAGLEQRVTVLERDYRLLQGRYDKLVSIEMIEAVGRLHLDAFFRCCSELLRPGGKMLLQAITIQDDAYEVEKASGSFIGRYIFPGGCLPSKHAIASSLKRCSDLSPIAIRDLTNHYPPTLRAWRERFEAGADRVAAGERFRRLWRLYLCYCEAGFIERRVEVGQMLLCKRGG
jgi:cyclopropane-fatty-acyl-phospholipid synthase